MKCALAKSSLNIGRPIVLPSSRLLGLGGTSGETLLFNFNSRTDGVIDDAVAGEEAHILDTRVAYFNGTTTVCNITPADGCLTGTQDFHIYCKFSLDSGSSGNHILFSVTNNFFKATYLSTNKWEIEVYDGINTWSVLQAVAVNYRDGVEREFELKIDRDASIILDIDGSTVINDTTPTATGSIFESYAFIGGRGAAGTLERWKGNVGDFAVCNTIQASVAALKSNACIWYPSVYDGIDISGNNYHCNTGSTFVIGYSDTIFHKLNKGYTAYTNGAATPAELQLPYNDSSSVVYSAATYTHNGTTYNKGSEFPTAQIHNLTDSIIDFNPTASVDAKYDILDRSNTTYQTATSRASSYYDVSNPWRYHISELTQTIIDTYIQAAYSGKAVITRDSSKLTSVKVLA
jgi:hypothetical protein